MSWSCGVCGNSNPEAAAVCNRCGHPSAKDRPRQQLELTCPTCKSIHRFEHGCKPDFCSCGTDLQGSIASAVAMSSALETLSLTLLNSPMHTVMVCDPDEEYVLGSNAFPAAMGVSERHCILFPDSNSWTIKDLGSTFGTYLNGKRLSEERVYTLTLPCVVRLGSAILKAEIMKEVQK